MGGTTSAIASVLVLFIAAAASAGERIEETGREAFATDVWEALELGEGHSVAIWRGRGVAYSDNPDSPMHLAAIDCAGSFEFMPGGATRDSGHCTYTTTDGDKLFDRWWQEPGALMARYEWLGGTGKLSGAKGGGTYTVTQLNESLLSVSYSGVLELP